MAKLNRSTVKRFSISYNDAVKLGLTDEDLKYITEANKNSFRISIPAFDKRRTKVVHDLLDAIKTKYEMVREIEAEQKEYDEREKLSNISKDSISKFSKVIDGYNLFITERKKDCDRHLIQITTYEEDITIMKNRLLRDNPILNMEIKDIDVDYAQKFVDDLWDTKTKKDETNLMENSIYKPYSLIHKLFNFFVKDLRIIQYNPFDNVKRKPQARSKDKKYFTVDEIHIIKEKLDYENIRFRSLITLIMDTGLRREEAIALKFGDINKLRQTIKIERAFVKSRLDSSYIIKPVKREKSEREIVCTTYALNLIDKYKKFKEACGFVINDDDFIFTAWDSLELIDPNRHSREFSVFLDKIGVQTKIPLKNLRHTHATYFVEKGKNLKAVQKRLGHANIETTLNIYAQTNLSEDKKLVEDYEKEFYNKLGLSISDIYNIVSNRFSDRKRLINILEKISDDFIDDSNFDIELERCQEYFKELFPIINKILTIDNILTDDDIDTIFVGFENKYKTIKIEALESRIKI